MFRSSLVRAQQFALATMGLALVAAGLALTSELVSVREAITSLLDIEVPLAASSVGVEVNANELALAAVLFRQTGAPEEREEFEDARSDLIIAHDDFADAARKANRLPLPSGELDALLASADAVAGLQPPIGTPESHTTPALLRAQLERIDDAMDRSTQARAATGLASERERVAEALRRLAIISLMALMLVSGGVAALVWSMRHTVRAMRGLQATAEDVATGRFQQTGERASPVRETQGVLTALGELSAEMLRCSTNQNFLSGTLDGMSDAVMVVNADGGIRFANSSAYRMFELGRTSVIGQNFASLVGDRMVPGEGQPAGEIGSVHGDWNGIVRLRAWRSATSVIPLYPQVLAVQSAPLPWAGDGDASALVVVRLADRPEAANAAELSSTTSNEARRRRLANDLMEAIRDDALHLHYQPIVDSLGGAVVAVEALLRWNHPQLGQIDPAEMIAIAEHGDAIHALGGWVLDRACLDAATWRRQPVPPPRVAINVSAKQMDRPDFAERVRDALLRSGLPASSLELELTETIAWTAETHATLRVLNRSGVRLVLDDFGASYSWLRAVQELPISSLKIDRQFVREMDHSPRARILVAGIIGTARALGLEITAEGVESHAVAGHLRHAGCTLMQGFVIEKPMPASAVSAVLLRRMG